MLVAILSLLCLLTSPLQAAPLTLTATGDAGAFTGLRVASEEGAQAEVLLQLAGKWTARVLERADDGEVSSLTLRDFDTSGTGGTPTLGAGSYVRLSAGRDAVWPTLSFRLEVEAFDPAAWKAGLGQAVPLSFLALPLTDARLWYVHGLLCPTPKLDPYPLTRATVGGSWAPGWSYGVALGALTVPAMALWDELGGRMAGYEWAATRLTDKSDKDLGIAYCAGIPGWPQQCLTLLGNAQADWTTLTYPQRVPVVLQSALRVMMAQDLRATDDVNRVVLQRIWADDQRLLSRVPAMNDLSWMVTRRLEELGGYGPSGGGFLQTVPDTGWGWNQFFYDGGTVLYGGGFRSVDQMYKQGKAEAIARFEGELAEFLSHARWEDIDGDRCCYWRFPLTGSWNAGMGGEAADTVHNVQQFGVGASLLACWANTGREELRPYIEGLFNWSRHYAFTRGDIADIPESMFTLQTSSLAMEFLMSYHHLFAGSADATQRLRAQEAFELAEMVVYRNANVTLGDSDERDDLSGDFMMPGNMAKFWLGQISNAELCLPFRSMIMMYAETGDPVFKWLVRGALERWWVGYKEDGWHTAENIDVWGVSTGTKGMQTGIHGPCDEFWEWAQPVGDAALRVTCGAKAALAFCTGTRALDVGEYRYADPGNFSFRVVRVGSGAVPEAFPIIVSSPWRDLDGLAVQVDGQPVTEGVQVLGTYREHLYVPGVRVGSRVQIGEVGEAPVREAVAVPVAQGPGQVPEEALRLAGRRFALTDLGPAATVGLADGWSSVDDWGGLPVGLAYAHGVPYCVQPRALGPGGSVTVEGKEAYLLGVAEKAGALKVDGQPVDPAVSLVAARGWPLCKWKLHLYPVALAEGKGRVDVSEGGLLLGVTTLQKGPGLMETLRGKMVAPAGEDTKLAPLVAEAKRRLEEAGGAGRAPVAFIPPQGRTCAILAQWARRLGMPSVELTGPELVSPEVFNARRFPVAVYTGNEEYLQTVRTPGDGDEALLRYLREGGTLLVAGICRPFTYGRDLTAPQAKNPPPEGWALFGKQFELFLLGPDEARADAIGFEKPPAGVELEMDLAPEQTALWDFPAQRAFPRTGDLRYRPLTVEGVSPRDEVLPIITTQDAEGKAYGAAAATIRHHCTEFDGAQVMWVWGTLLLEPFEQREQVAAEMLTAAVTSAQAATEPLPAALDMTLPPAKLRVAVLPPDCGGREEIIRGACAATGATPVMLSPDQFVSEDYFSAGNFPVAIQGAAGESFIVSYRRDRDGEDAYKRYLKQGGTLIVCQRATPFWYELVWDGTGWKGRQPERFWSMAFDLGFETEYGFEKPQEPMWLQLTGEGRKLWPGLGARTELGGLSDQRWRSLIPYRSTAAREFVPLAYATKPDGTRYGGLAAAEIRFGEGSEYAGARLIYLWGNMVEGAVGEELLRGCLAEAAGRGNAQETP